MRGTTGRRLAAKRQDDIHQVPGINPCRQVKLCRSIARFQQATRPRNIEGVNINPVFTHSGRLRIPDIIPGTLCIGKGHIVEQQRVRTPDSITLTDKDGYLGRIYLTYDWVRYDETGNGTTRFTIPNR